MDRRYKKRMARHWAEADAKARRVIDNLDPDSWFDYWHTHVDWRGRANSRPENWLAVHSVVVQLLEHLDAKFAARTKPIQTWATLCTNTMYSAVNAHSQNPNGTPFPRDFSEVNWGPAVSEAIAGLVPEGYEIGSAECGGKIEYIVMRRSLTIRSTGRQPAARAGAG